MEISTAQTDIHAAVESQRSFFYANATRSYKYRLQALNKLRGWIIRNEPKIFDALEGDLGKSDFESYLTEVGQVREEVRYAIKNLKKWMKPIKRPTPLAHFPSKSRIYPQPYGVALVMSPWNYPFQLTINPLIGAVAAGNCCMVKPSNYAPKTAQLIADIVRDCFDPRHVDVVLGGREQNTQLLKQRFDYIFFTGGMDVGRLVMESAIPNITPVTLELGGKSPCIVDDTANINYAAKRIVFGKFMNSGQTCVAPDYLYVHEDRKDELVHRMIDSIQQFYTEKPLESPVYPNIVNQKHFERLLGLMQGEDILFGGKSDAEKRKIMPTLIENASWDSPVMQEEIFGPLLPILTFSKLDEALDMVKAQPRPLALYLFTGSAAVKEYVRETVPFGGGCVNDTIVHIATPRLPFGGVGYSGMGNYHGKNSFDTFSHHKSILEKANWIDLPMRYLPGTEKKFNIVRKLLK